MTNNDRNVRTLIVCFTLALVALVPLKFYEDGQLRSLELTNSSVLGISSELKVVLPNDTVEVTERSLLEAPYNEEVVEGCLSDNQVDEKLIELTEIMTTKLLDQKSLDNLEEQIEVVLNNKCN